MVPVGFTWAADDTDALSEGVGLARVTMRVTSRKARNVSGAPGGTARAVLCSVEGRSWITLEGAATISADPDEVAEALRRYALRYQRTPGHDPARVVLRLVVDKVMASADLR
ncbi:MAG: hypothetical protein AVDCRST_MAG35-2554 [uncultured Quadrisphaera sp.]|uniref:Pyridoxamine 5'-phosphate oxidase putative domain-containing protein n=1 Tax=uncultured Quadrisphaera sp. TaxID=904978 RepID=A0A6J4Q1J6_9ACTN|nr:MAG: hypothetical protein AVDCRST_MAG35-2554 [uncultured Quadrisphaera sp.]